MSQTRVVHINDNVPGAVYIGRAMNRRGLAASPFANAYRIGGPSNEHDAFYAVLNAYFGTMVREERTVR